MDRLPGKVILSIAVAAILVTPTSALAYIGPGGVITAVGAMLALLVAIIASIAGFLWYPLKRLLAWTKGIRGRDETTVSAPPRRSSGS